MLLLRVGLDLGRCLLVGSDQGPALQCKAGANGFREDVGRTGGNRKNWKIGRIKRQTVVRGLRPTLTFGLTSTAAKGLAALPTRCRTSLPVLPILPPSPDSSTVFVSHSSCPASGPRCSS